MRQKTETLNNKKFLIAFSLILALLVTTFLIKTNTKLEAETVKTQKTKPLPNDYYLKVRKSMNTPKKYIKYESVGKFEKRVIKNHQDGANIPIRIYTPKNYAPNGPILVYVHGGGWVAGNIKSLDNYNRHITNALNVKVIAVNYRLAPESKLPKGLEDVYSAVKWVKESANTLNIDPNKIFIMGESAGGNIAAAATLLIRDRNLVNLRGQILNFSPLTTTMKTNSWKTLGKKYFPTARVHMYNLKKYIPKNINWMDLRVAPMESNNLSDLPDALLLSGELDPLYGDSIIYARKLNNSGVNARFIKYSKAKHAFTEHYANSESIENKRAALKAYAAMRDFIATKSSQ